MEGKDEKKNSQSGYQIVTSANIKLTIKRFNLIYGTDNKLKFKKLISTCMDDLLERILKEEISDWKSLEEVYLNESFSQDNLVSLCCQWRDKFETPLCLVERMIK